MGVAPESSVLKWSFFNKEKELGGVAKFELINAKVISSPVSKT